MGPADGTNNVVLQKLSDLNQEMIRVEAQVLANQYDSVKSATQSNFPESLKTPTMKDLEHRLSTLQEKHSDMALEFGPKWPELVALDEQIADVKRQLESETKRSLQQVKMDHDLAEAHRQRVAAAVADQTGLADRLSQDSIQYNILKREVETDRQLRDGLLQRLKETGISEGFRFANIRVIDSAKVQSKPDSPNVPMNLALGLTMGLTCGLMLAFFGEFIDRTVKTPEDVEQTLGLPFLATIPVFQKSWKKATGGLLVQGERRTHENALVPSMNFGGHMYWESYRSLRTSLLLSSSDDRRPQTILVTSSLPGEGKSSTVVNLGITLAQTGARTLILELDLRKPSLGNLFHLPKANGMSRYLAGHTDLHTQILSAGIPNLFIIPAGPALPNPPELMGSKRMDLALNLLSGYFDYIVIDSPPVMAVTDALVIASQADGVVLVVQGGKTPKAVVQNTRNLLLGVGARILGALITRADPKNSGFGYYHREVYSNDTDSYSAVS
jgi:capsular exopolysaccharide synthesis family protein